MSNGQPAQAGQSRAGATWGGIGAGAATGAATGGGIGALVGGPAGIAVGAGIGGLIGGIGGGLAGYAHGGDSQTGAGVSSQAQRDALARLGAGVDAGRAGVLGAYDQAIATNQARNQEAIRQMRMGLAAPAAGTLVGSGAAGLLGSGAAQASGRQAALTASLRREDMMRAGAEQEARILQQKAAQQLGFAEADIGAMQARFTAINQSIEDAKKSHPTRGDFINWAMGKRNSYPPGTPEFELFNNAILATQDNLMFSG